MDTKTGNYVKKDKVETSKKDKQYDLTHLKTRINHIPSVITENIFYQY